MSKVLLYANPAVSLFFILKFLPESDSDGPDSLSKSLRRALCSPAQTGSTANSPETKSDLSVLSARLKVGAQPAASQRAGRWEF